MSTVTDFEIFQRFTAMADELEQMAAQSASLVGSTALKTACQSLRGIARAVYEHAISEEGGLQ